MLWASLVAQMVKNRLQYRRPGFCSWGGKIPWRREQLSTLVFWPGDRGAWQATVHGVTKSWSWLSDFQFHFHSAVVRKDAWCDFSFLKLTKVWCVAQCMIYPGECSVCTQLRNQTRVSHIVGGFFTIWATKEARNTMKSPLNIS